MKEVNVTGPAYRATLSSGREVRVLRGDDGEHYGFRFGPEGDRISFCLTKEAVNFMVAAIDRLDRDARGPTTLQWTCTFNDGGDAAVIDT